MHLDNHTKKLLSKPDTRRAWVIYQLTLRGESLASVARRKGVSRQAMQKVLTHPYPKMEKVLADFLGIAPSSLFPERYDQHTGLPNRMRGRPVKSVVESTKHTSRAPRRNVHAKAAA
jgi:Ner family transcriptional regulator